MATEVHCINSGQGNSVALRLPDGAYMIVDIDCHGVTPVDPIDYLKELVPEKYAIDEGRYVRRLACAAFTHPHQDHISGLKPLVEAGFIFDELWESGHRLSDKEAKDNAGYKEYLEVIKEYEAKGKVRKPTSASGKWRENFHGADVYCLGPSSHLNAADAEDTSRKAIHNRCLVLRVVTEEMSVLLPGDSAVNQWRDRIVPNYDDELLEADVLVASHHGSRTFFKDGEEDDPYEDAIIAIAPDYTVISVGRDNDYDLPNKDALQLYQDNSGVGIAQTSVEGSIVVTKENGELTAKPSPIDAQVEKAQAATISASVALSTVPQVSLSAVLLDKNSHKPIQSLKSGISKVHRDEYIVFSADVRNRPIGSRLQWEVKNRGVDDHSHHSEHYERSEELHRRYDHKVGRTDDEHEWTRHTSYTGRHECIVKLVDPLWDRTLDEDHFVVEIGRPRPRNQRRMGRRRP